MDDLSDLITPKTSERMTKEKIAKFLEYIADGGSVTGAARSIGFTPQRMYQLREQYPQFRLAWAEAREAGTDEYEDRLNKSSKQGNIAATIFALKCRRPEIYNPGINLRGSIDHDRIAAPAVTEAILEGEREAANPLTFRTAPALPSADDDHAEPAPAETPERQNADHPSASGQENEGRD